MTVKEVADICKKYNKDLKTISTNDPIPNNGYTLSNEKIKKAGFKFLYKLDKSIEEIALMISGENVTESAINQASELLK